MSNELIIDGIKVPFTQGQTIMDAALAAGIYIPHLCHHPDYSPHGSCRLCIVTVNGRQVTACTSQAVSGCAVENNSDDLMEKRRQLLKLLFIEGNHVCPACEKSGACKLQALAYHCGMLASEFSPFYPEREVDASHSDIAIDFNRCILCGLCVRASQEEDHKSVFCIAGRGINSYLTINSVSGKLGDSDLTVSDKAAHICPVGAILPKHTAYNVPVGQRPYDGVSIAEVDLMPKRKELNHED